MTVEELVKRLQGMPPKATVRLVIGGPDDSAFTKMVEGVEYDDGDAVVRGWAASDDEDAFLPS